MIPQFWSGQFGINIKSVGVPSFGDEIMFTQGSVKERRFAAAYGRRGRIVGAVTFNHGKWIPYYEAQIARSGPFPPNPAGSDFPEDMRVMPAEFPARGVPTETPDVVLTGHDPAERRAEFRPARASAIAGTRANVTPKKPLTRKSLDDASTENRANPYPFFDELRKTPVARVTNGVYAVTGYEELIALAHDPRVSSDMRKGQPTGRPRRRIADQSVAEMIRNAGGYGQEPSFIAQDPPEHDRARRSVHALFRATRFAGLIPGQEPLCQQIVNELLDKAIGTRPASTWSTTSPTRCRST